MMTAMVPSAAAPPDAADEAYRILRTSVKFAEGEASPRTVLVADIDRARPSDVGARLALAFARAGDTCAFVDLTAPPGDGPGLAGLIRGDHRAADVIDAADHAQPIRIPPGADFQPDLLASAGFAEAVAALRERFAYALFSCASLPARGDALAIAPRVDATVLVVTSGKTRRPRAVEARDALERVGANVLGVVLLETKRRLFW